MGLFSSKAEREAKAKAKAEAREVAINASAIKLAENKGIEYSNDDLYALRCIVESFENNNDINVSSSSVSLDDSNGNSCSNNIGNITYDVLSEIQDLDSNNYRFFKAIIEQNYMTMRKVDALKDLLEQLINLSNNGTSPRSTTAYCAQCGKPRNSSDAFCPRCGHRH